jgi:hypothetical protein
MQEMTGSRWKRTGCSLVWSLELLTPLVTDGDAVPLRVALGWLKTGFPTESPGHRKTVLVGGLPTVLTLLPTPESRFHWLQQNILPLARGIGNHWAAVGLIFAMEGPASLFTLNEADDLVYFGRGPERSDKVAITQAMWAGAATGTGTFQLIVPGTKTVGGYYVDKVS